MHNIVYPKHPMDPVEIIGHTPPLVRIYENGECSIPQPEGTDLGRFGENAEGAVLWTAAGYVCVKRVNTVISRPIALKPHAFAYVEWFVGPPRR
jgi:hypothetical protein